MEDKVNKNKDLVKKTNELNKNYDNDSYLGFKSKYMFLMFLGTCHT